MSREFSEEEKVIIAKSIKVMKNWSKYRVLLLIASLLFIVAGFLVNSLEINIPLKFMIAPSFGGVFLGVLIRNWKGPKKDKFLSTLL